MFTFFCLFLCEIIPIINLKSILENDKMSFKLVNQNLKSDQNNIQYQTLLKYNKTEINRKLSENIIMTKTVYILTNSKNPSFSIKLKKNKSKDIQIIKYNKNGTNEEELNQIYYEKIESNLNFDELVINLPFEINNELVNYTFYIEFLELIDTFELEVTDFIILDPVVLIQYFEIEIPFRVRLNLNENKKLLLKTENEIYNINSIIELGTNEYLITFILNEKLINQKEYQLIYKTKNEEENSLKEEEIREIYIALYSISNKCIQYLPEHNYVNNLIEIEVYLPNSLNNVDIALSINNNDYLLERKLNNVELNSYTYSYVYTNLNKNVYGLKIFPYTLYYGNNSNFFYETLELYDPYLGIDTNSEFYYDIQVIHRNSEINSLYFVFNTTFNPTDIFKLYFTEMCYNNGNAIECYFSNYFPTNKYFITRYINCDKSNIYNIDLPSSFNILVKNEPTITSISPNFIYQKDIKDKSINIIAKYKEKKEIINTIQKIILRKVHEESMSFNFDDIIIKNFIINNSNETITIPITRLNIGLYKIYIIFRTSENLTMIEPTEIFYITPYNYSSEKFIYIDAPKIEYNMEISLYDFEEEEIHELGPIEIFDELYYKKNEMEEINDNIIRNDITFYSISEQYSISIDCEDNYINDDNNYKCSLIDLNNGKILKENKPGYYFLIIGNNIVSNNFFLSKPLNQSEIFINLKKELYLSTNNITIKSDEFLLNELENFNFESYDTNEEYNDFIIEKYINETNNSLSEINITFTLKKDKPIIFKSLQRKKMFYEKNCDDCFKNINISLLANMYYPRLDFNHIYIFLDSILYNDDSGNNLDEFNKTILKGYGNEEFILDKIEGIYVIQLNNSTYINKLNYTNNEYSFIPNSTGLYKFAYRFNERLDEYFPIEQFVIVEKNFTDLFIFEFPNTYISLYYAPIIAINTTYKFSDYLSLSEIGFLLNDKSENISFKFNYVNGTYFLPDETKVKINPKNLFELIILEHNNAQFYVWKENISISISPLSDNFYFKNKIVFDFEFNYSEFDNLYIVDVSNNKKYELDCNLTKYEAKEIILCSTKNLIFENKMEDYFNIYYTEFKIYDKKLIYNIFEESDYIILFPGVTNQDFQSDIMIFSNNFNMNYIDYITIINQDNNTEHEFSSNKEPQFILNKDNSIIIRAIFNQNEIYKINTIVRKSYKYDNFNDNKIKIINKIIEKTELIFEVESKLLLISKYTPNVDIKLTVTGNGIKYIDKIYYKISTDDEYNDDNYLNKSGNIYSIKGINKHGKYVFAYTYLKSNFKYSIKNIYQMVFSENDSFFNSKIDTKCILSGQPFEIKLIPLSEKILLTNQNLTSRLYDDGKEDEYFQLKYNESIDKYQFEDESILLLNGTYTFKIFLKIGNNELELYSLSGITYSNFSISNFFYKDYIYVDNVDCNFDLFGIIPMIQSTSSIVPFICETTPYIEKRINCRVSTSILIFGNYSLYFGNYNTTNIIFISNTISDSYFSIIQPSETDKIYPGILAITIENTNEDFYMSNLKHIIIKSNKDKNEEKKDIVINSKNSFSFKLEVKEDYIYSFFIYRNNMEYYDTEINIYNELNQKIYIQKSPFILKSDNITYIDKSNDTLQNILFTLEFNKSEVNNIEINEIKLNPYPNNKKCSIEQSKNNLVNCNYLIKNIEAGILEIKFRFWVRYIYIFTYESSGTFCKNNYQGSLIFKLDTPKFYTNLIQFKYNSVLNLGCGNYTDHSFNHYTCEFKISNNNSPKSTIVIKTNKEKEIKIETNEIYTNIASVSGKLIEGISIQQLKVLFEDNILEDEFKQCILTNINSPSQILSSVPKFNLNNRKLIILQFSLMNVEQGSYSLSCENKCGKKIVYREDINIIKIKCSAPTIRISNNENNPSCKFCNETSKTHLFYQEGICSERCDSSINYAVRANEKHWCGFCYEKEERNGIDYCIENCAKGTIEYKGVCYLPDDPIIKSIKDKSMICRALCVKDHYIDCDTIWMKCKCKDEYKGLFCEFNSSITNIQYPLESINRYIYGNDDFNYSNPNLVAQIKSTLSLIERSTDFIPSNFNDAMNNFSIYTYRTIELMEYSQIKNLFYFIQLSLCINLYSTKGRRLEENNNDIEKLLLNAHKINVNGAIETGLPEEGYKIFSDDTGLISFIWYRQSAFNELFSYLKHFPNSTISLINFTDCINDDNDIIIITSIPNKIMSYIENYNFYNKSSLGINIFASHSKNIDEDLLEKCKYTNYQTYVPALSLNYNYSLFNSYKIKGINIYNESDEAFNDPCYTNDKFDYDLTQKYRRNKVYQNISFNSKYCSFVEIHNETNKVLFNCTGDQKNNILLNEINKSFNNTKIYNLPFKCYNKIKNLQKNIAFYIYSFVIIFLIILLIVNQILYNIKEKNIEQQLPSNPPKNENEENKNIETNKTEQIKIIYESIDESLEDNERNEQNINNSFNDGKINVIIKETEEAIYQKDNKKINNESLMNYIWQKCLKNHPLLNLSQYSEKYPLLKNHFIFLFNISCIFGFNALFFNEERIEKKIFAKDRNKFSYHLKHEFQYILLSIFISMLLTSLIRFIFVLSYREKDQKLENNNEFKFIAFLIIFGTTFFFAFYCIAWCYSYYNTQFGWLYMGIWCLLFKWIFALIFIIFIILFEKKMGKDNDCVFNFELFSCF